MAARKVPPHPLVSRLQGTAKQPEKLTSVVGWPGDAESADRVRVYLDTGFTTYYELSSDDVVNTVPTDPANENAPTMVWVRSSAKADLTSTQSVSGDIGFLSGGISRGNLAGASRNARFFSANRVYQAESGTWSCPIETLEGPCETRNIFCPTRQCGPTSESYCTIGSFC